MNNNFINKFLKGSISTSIGTFSTVLFHFLSITLIARFVSKTELGLYFLILAITNGGKILSGLGLDLTLTRFLVAKGEELEEKQQNAFAVVMWTRLTVLLFLSGIVYLLGSILFPYLDPGIVAYTWAIPVLFTLLSFRELFFYVLQGLQYYKSYAIIQTSSAVLKCSYIWLMSDQLTLEALIYIELAMVVSSLLIQFFFIPFKKLKPLNLLPRWETFREVLLFGTPIYLNALLTYASGSGGIFIISTFLTPASIAAFSVADKIPQGFARLFVSFRIVYFPSLAKLFTQGDFVNAQKLVNKCLTLLATGSFTLVLIAALFSHEIIIAVFTEKYIEVKLTFVLMMFGACMRFLSTTMGYSLVSAGHPKYSTKCNSIALPLGLLISLFLVPKIGYIGAACSFVLVSFVSQALNYYYLRVIKVNVNLAGIFKPLLFLGATIAVYLLGDNPSIIFRGGILLSYIICSLVFIPECRQAITILRNFTRVKSELKTA